VLKKTLAAVRKKRRRSFLLLLREPDVALHLLRVLPVNRLLRAVRPWLRKKKKKKRKKKKKKKKKRKRTV
jgi:hypothetical protein